MDYLYIKWVNYIMMNHLEVAVSEPMFHIAFAAREEIVYYNHLMALCHKYIYQVRADKSCASRHLKLYEN